MMTQHILFAARQPRNRDGLRCRLEADGYPQYLSIEKSTSVDSYLVEYTSSTAARRTAAHTSAGSTYENSFGACSHTFYRRCPARCIATGILASRVKRERLALCQHLTSMPGSTPPTRATHFTAGSAAAPPSTLGTGPRCCRWTE
jgi:hypothetical protein